MNNTKLAKAESLAIEQLSQKPVKELARLAYNTAGLDDYQTDLVLDAIPYAIYKIPVPEYRKQFQLLEWIVDYCGMFYWKSQSRYLLGCLTEHEFNGVALGLRDLVEYYGLDFEKVSILTMDAGFLKASGECCEVTRKMVFDDVLENADRFF